MHEFQYDYVRIKHEKKKLYYVDTDSFIVFLKAEDT